jgi:hypothetical protein
MPDDYIDLNKQDDEQKNQETAEVTSWWIGRWAHVIALLVFGIVYLPFDDRIWGWQVAATLSYIVFMLCCTCGLSFQDSDDLFGNLPVARFLAGLLVRQFFILALISLGLYEWRHAIPALPNWATERAIRNLSLWEVAGIILVYVIAVREATWMAKKIKQQFPEIEEPLDSIQSESEATPFLGSDKS